MYDVPPGTISTPAQPARTAAIIGAGEPHPPERDEPATVPDAGAAGEPARVPPIADEPSHLEPEPEPELDEPDGQPRAGLPILSVGSFDPIVPQLCAKLAELGYDTPTSRGENPHAIIGSEELQAARQFRRDHVVTDDADAFAHGEADQHIGPWTIEAILSA